MIPCSEEGKKLIWMHSKRMWLFIQMELEACRDGYNLLRRCYLCAVNNCPQVYCPPMPLPIPPDCINSLNKRLEMTRKGILLLLLTTILKTRYPLLVQQQPPPVFLPSYIPPFPSPLPCAEPKLLGNAQIKSNYLEVLADGHKEERRGILLAARPDGMTGTH